MDKFINNNIILLNWYYSCKCGSESIDHLLLTFYYGESCGPFYFLLKLKRAVWLAQKYSHVECNSTVPYVDGLK